MISMDLANDVINRWVDLNSTILGLQGELGEGTTVDLDEPFLLHIQ